MKVILGSKEGAYKDEHQKERTRTEVLTCECPDKPQFVGDIPKQAIHPSGIGKTRPDGTVRVVLVDGHSFIVKPGGASAAKKE